MARSQSETDADDRAASSRTLTGIRRQRNKQTLVTQTTLNSLSPLSILLKKRGNALRRSETVGKALDRLEGKKEYQNVLKRHRMYLASVAALTLSIDTLRQAEGKEVRVLGSSLA